MIMNTFYVKVTAVIFQHAIEVKANGQKRILLEPQ